jgi:arabinogalactan endo-1,4-beta-galactosidase
MQRRAVKRTYLIAILVLIAMVPGALRAAPLGKAFLAGADVSDYGYIQNHGGVYRYDHKTVGLISAFKQAGCNCLRLRLWHRAAASERAKRWTLGSLNNLAYNLPLAQQIKKAGLYFVLDMHFSDTWADPGHQFTPAAWKNLRLPQLRLRLRAYCQRVITTLRQAHAMPDMVLVGNEINNGMLWPRGKLWVKRRARWDRLASLLNAAIAGIDAGSGAHRPQMMIQVSDFSYAPEFYKQLIAHGVHFDVIGYDYYPWGGPLKNLRARLNMLAREIHKPIIVAETAYPWIDDAHNNSWKHKSGMQFPFTPAGQAAYAKAVIHIVKALPGHLGRGVWWWGAEYNPDQKVFRNNPWSYRSLFDLHGNALPAMRVLGAAAR